MLSRLVLGLLLATWNTEPFSSEQPIIIDIILSRCNFFLWKKITARLWNIRKIWELKKRECPGKKATICAGRQGHLCAVVIHVALRLPICSPGSRDNSWGRALLRPHRLLAPGLGLAERFGVLLCITQGDSFSPLDNWINTSLRFIFFLRRAACSL